MSVKRLGDEALRREIAARHGRKFADYVISGLEEIRALPADYRPAKWSGFPSVRVKAEYSGDRYPLWVSPPSAQPSRAKRSESPRRRAGRVAEVFQQNGRWFVRFHDE